MGSWLLATVKSVLCYQSLRFYREYLDSESSSRQFKEKIHLSGDIRGEEIRKEIICSLRSNALRCKFRAEPY